MQSNKKPSGSDTVVSEEIVLTVSNLIAYFYLSLWKDAQAVKTVLQE